MQSESVGYRLVQQHIYESEEVQTDESFFPVCLMNVCMIKLSLESNSFFFVMFAQQNRLRVNTLMDLQTDFMPAFRFSCHQLWLDVSLHRIDPKKGN